MKSEVATLQYDLASIKKIGAQQRDDLKKMGNLIMSELKFLREKSTAHDASLIREDKLSSKLTTELPQMAKMIQTLASGLTSFESDLGNMTKEIKVRTFICEIS